MPRPAPLLVCAVLGSLLVAASGPSAVSVGTPTGAKPARAAVLRVRPAVFVAGQSLTFRGTLGSKAKQEVHLQTHMNRPGDTWLDLEGSESQTKSGGRFAIRRPAPSMVGISYRAVVGRRHTAPLLMSPRPQEAILQADSGLEGWAPGDVLAGQPFTISVATAPLLPGGQQALALPGRTVTLQRRVGATTWQSIGSSTVDATGAASFALTAGPAGDVVYRARLEDWSARRNEVGWHPSFPTYVHVLDGPRETRAAPGRRTSSSLPGALPDTGALPTAAAKYGWGEPTYGFEWEFGQSLTSAPSHGSTPRGSWTDLSDGTGRAFIRNGALAMSSEAYGGSAGTQGDTWATVDGASDRYGRWEARVWTQSLPTYAADFAMTFELVPALGSQYACGARNVTIAELSAHGSSVLIGAGAPATGQRWTRVVNRGPVNKVFHNFAVEVDKDHITWFINGAPVASTSEPSLLTGVALRPRISLRSQDAPDLNSTQVLMDWIRAYGPRAGKPVTRNLPLTPGPAVPRC